MSDDLSKDLLNCLCALWLRRSCSAHEEEPILNGSRTQGAHVLGDQSYGLRDEACRANSSHSKWHQTAHEIIDVGILCDHILMLFELLQ